MRMEIQEVVEEGMEGRGALVLMRVGGEVRGVRMRIG